MRTKVMTLLKWLLLYFFMMMFTKVHALTFVVDNAATNDNGMAYTLGDGTNTLRKCIRLANANAGADIINFNFAGATTIALSSCLPQIISPVTIDGYSNPGASAGNLRIEVTATACSGVFDLGPGSDGSIIRGIVISGGSIGIRAQNSHNHIFKGNYIGTNMAGTAMAGVRVQDGININSCNNVVIGGTGGQIDRNLISGGTQDGIRVVASLNLTVINNYIGTDVTGNINLGNNGNGIDGYDNGVTGSNNMHIGGTTAAEQNVISGNHSNGIYLNKCQSPVVKGNIIGMGLNGSTMMGNLASGIDIENTGTAATAPIIGGATSAERNYSSCNGAFGIVVRSAPGAVLQGNWLGVDAATGLLDFGNFDAAITVTNSADVQCLGNICSGSGNPGFGADGISIWNNSPRPIIKGNIIGLGADGTTPLQNYGHGIECLTCDDGIIGGTSASERNVIAMSFYLGIQCVNSPRVTIINNYIGTDISGTLDRGGTQAGINIGGSSNDVVIGGSAAGKNIIAFNNASGGVVLESTVQHVLITFNSIFCNAGPGIDLAGSANETVAAPVVISSTANTISGTGANGHTVHIYRNFKADGGVKCNCEGEVYIGSALVSGGIWTFTHNLNLAAAEASSVSATQTTPANSTSEFSNCTAPLPVDLIFFMAYKNENHSTLLEWATASEKNNHHFTIQRSTDGLHFENIGTVAGNGTSYDIKKYSFIDLSPNSGINYYRLQQTDYDGTSSFSFIRSLDLSSEAWNIIPDKGGFTILHLSKHSEEIRYTLHNTSGKLILQNSILFTEDLFSAEIKSPLPPGIYLITLESNQQFYHYKLFLTE